MILSMATFDDVRKIALSLPETDEHASYGGRSAFRVHKKGFVHLRDDETSLSVYVSDLGEKEALLVSDPRKFFTEDHYNGYAAVLLRLDEVDVDELRELLVEAWRVQAPKRLRKAFEAQEPGAG